jgi:hypothetical protein
MYSYIHIFILIYPFPSYFLFIYLFFCLHITDPELFSEFIERHLCLFCQEKKANEESNFCHRCHSWWGNQPEREFNQWKRKRNKQIREEEKAYDRELVKTASMYFSLLCSPHPTHNNTHIYMHRKKLHVYVYAFPTHRRVVFFLPMQRIRIAPKGGK